MWILFKVSVEDIFVNEVFKLQEKYEDENKFSARVGVVVCMTVKGGKPLTCALSVKCHSVITKSVTRHHEN